MIGQVEQTSDQKLIRIDVSSKPVPRLAWHRIMHELYSHFVVDSKFNEDKIHIFRQVFAIT